MKQPRLNPSKQTGNSIYLLLFLAMCVGFILLCVFKFWSFYVDFYVLRGAIDDLPEDPKFSKMSGPHVRGAIMKRLNVSSVYTVQADYIDVEKYDGGVLVYVDYESRIPLFSNIDAVLKFEYEKEFEIK